MSTLDAVSKARKRRMEAEAAFQAAIRDARQQGLTLEAIGQAAGMTRAAVLARLRRT